ncbi:MAG: M28 family peptidase [Flavobacteriales bacterium]
MRPLLTLLVILGSSLFSFTSAQTDSLLLRYARTITAAELRQHLEVLASDAYMGRNTGYEGQKMAAAYLKEQFQAAGIPPVPAPDPSVITEGYFQAYGLIEERGGSITMAVSGDTLKLKSGLLYFGENLRSDRTLDQLQWLGRGEEKAIRKARSKTVLLQEDGALGANELMPWLGAQVQALKTKGVEVILVATPRMAQLVEAVGGHVGGSRMRLADNEKKQSTSTASTQLILIDETLMDKLLTAVPYAKLTAKKAGKMVPVNAVLTYRSGKKDLVAENVLAYIEGTDKKDEIVVLTAHYDHIGVEDGVVYNGADDDGTGTVAMIEIAEAFALAKAAGHGPRRSVLVMPVSGEEKGLLGSRYYSDHPVFPLANTVADLNIDMIGRTDSAHIGSEPYVYVIGSDRLSSELHAVNEAANAGGPRLTLDYTFNAPDDPNRFYYRSDHYNFARKGVPSIFYFSGVHEDYHQPGDDVEKIQFDLLEQRTLLVFHTAWILANQEHRIALDKAVEP